MDENVILETIKLVSDSQKQANELNKRLVAGFVVVICAIIISLSVMMSIVAYTYFTADYDYGTVTQYQDDSQQRQTVENGDE